METLEKEIQELKNKHATLELKKYNDQLKEKYKELKKLEGTVEVRIIKSSKTTRHVNIIHHVKYEMMIDTWKKPNEPEHNYIGQNLLIIKINEASRKPYKSYEIETKEIVPDGYNGKIHVKEESYSMDFSTYKTISVETFNTIWNIAKSVTANVLDGILDIKDVKWLMTGSEADREFKTTQTNEYQKFALDIPHILLTQEESWKLENKFTRIFLHKNIYLISPNSLLALDDWLDYEIKNDRYCASACASVGERWRGSRIDEYRNIVNKIKNH